MMIAKINHDYKTMRITTSGSVDVLGWSTYPDGSVLAGQPCKAFLDNFPDVDAAKAAYPDVVGFTSIYNEPRVSLSHLPGENDPVPGGMYPDDIGA